MPDATTTVFFTPTDPPPIARTMPFEGTGRVMLVMPGGVTLHGEPGLIEAWLRAGLDALSDGSVRWGATEAVVIVPEHPSVNHAPKPIGYELSDQPLCGAEGNVGTTIPVTCPACLEQLDWPLYEGL